jgi:hypothetical protein
MVHDSGAIVGAYLAHYSEQKIDGRPERFCNLGVWQVLPEHRMHSIRLLKAILDQDGYHFTDLTPAENVIALNARLGFRELDTKAFAVPCLPWPTLARRVSVTSDPSRLEQALQGEDLAIYRDHLGAAGLRHVAILDRSERCYMVLRPDRHRGLPVLTMLHVTEPTLLRRNSRAFARHLLLHHRVCAYLAEERVARCRPRLSFALEAPQTRMFRSDRLGAEDIGYLYSELVCLPDD